MANGLIGLLELMGIWPRKPAALTSLVFSFQSTIQKDFIFVGAVQDNFTFESEVNNSFTFVSQVD
jgi:hypothetical protein